MTSGGTGTDVSDTRGKDQTRIKKLLKARGVKSSLVDSCRGLHALRILAIRHGVTLHDEEIEDELDVAGVASSPIDAEKLFRSIDLDGNGAPRGAQPFQCHDRAVPPAGVISASEFHKAMTGKRKHELRPLLEASGKSWKTVFARIDADKSERHLPSTMRCSAEAMIVVCVKAKPSR